MEHTTTTTARPRSMRPGPGDDRPARHPKVFAEELEDLAEQYALDAQHAQSAADACRLWLRELIGDQPTRRRRRRNIA